jgi:hypothetical protein
LFSEYVDYLYDLKKNSERDSPFFIISKLLLNGLYGRFGMTPESEEHIIVTPDEGLKIQRDNNKIVNAITVLSNGKELISFFNLPDNSDKMKNKTKNISVVVASIVTASARIHMSQFKNNNNYTVYYSDTDSLDINRELDPKFIGKELGQMKLEHVFEEAVFLAPKMYGGINQNYEYVRIKGLKNPIKFNELKSLIKKDMRLGIPQEK